MSAERNARRAPPSAAPAIPDLPLAGERTDDLVRLTLPDGDGCIDLAAVFGNDRPVELEVGVGKGRFILLAATARPEINFLGIEYARKYLEQAIDRVGKRALENVRLVHGEAVALVRDCLEPGSLSGAHVYFPDPWPKKRHHKRRFVRPDALDALARALEDRSRLRVVTDHAEYAQVIAEVVDAHPAFERLGEHAALWELPGMADYTTVGVTNFEIKYRREGRSIHRFAWRRAARRPGGER